MIEKLYLKNYLIIKDAEINFSEGLNILTGETGAGKSIIIDAVSLILGERADYSKIMKDQDKLIVEAVFDFSKNTEIMNMLKEIFPDEEINAGNLIFRRELMSKGVSRNFINDTPVSISDMKRLGDKIIDIHSQNEHQSLLDRGTHLGILDDFMNEDELLRKYRADYTELNEMVKVYESLILKKDDFVQRRNYIEHELKEINNLNVKVSEDSELEDELRLLENSENISMSLTAALNYLYNDDASTVASVGSVLRELKKISAFDKNIEKIAEDLENLYIGIKDINTTLSGYLNNLNFDNQRTEQVRTRLSSINHLKKKLGLNIEEIIKRGESLSKELSIADNFDYEQEKLLNEINNKSEQVFKLASKLSQSRKKKSAELEKKINSLLSEVGLENAGFKVELNDLQGNENDLLSIRKGKDYLKLSANGFNDAEFLIRTNKGTEFSQLRKSASGGEISRIMLAIKTVLSEKDKVQILIFDEIDAGISGRIAQKVGNVLKNLSKTHQIICITHLPQIAAMSETHFHVSKKDVNGTTIAGIKQLTENEKLTEVAGLLSGEKVTDAAKKSAKELMKS